MNEFAKAIGRKPNLVGYYSGWNEPFQSGFAETAAQHGAATIVQIDPAGIPLAKVASGAYDSYLARFATAVAAFGHPVVISFGREMNGFWYSWGYHHTPPAVFVAAWRHIVTLFRQHGATNVKWLWQVNSKSPQTGPVRDWWPGAQYVNWVGVSGYYVVPTDTFSYIFNPVVADVRQFTHDPVLIAETGVRPSSGQQRGIRDLFSGLRSQGYLGLAWFDENTPGAPIREATGVSTPTLRRSGCSATAWRGATEPVGWLLPARRGTFPRERPERPREKSKSPAASGIEQ